MRRQPEKDIERTIVGYVRDVLKGSVVEFSQRRAGRCKRCGMSVPAGSQQTLGIPDLRLHVGGVAIWCEVKAGKRKETPEQRRFLVRAIEEGERAICAWSLNDVLWALHRYGLETKQVASQRRPPHPRTAFWLECWESHAA